MSISDISNGFGFLGGLGMFLYGMNIMADGMQKTAGSKMSSFLGMLTNNRFLAVALGALITAIIQSSGATTVMVVGFVNAGTRWDMVEQLREDIRTFKANNNCDRIAVLWAASTEIYVPLSEEHKSLAALEKAMKENNTEVISPSMCYAYAAIAEGAPFIMGAPNLCVDTPAMWEFSKKMNVPISGKDFKSGQTLMKTVLAPMFKTRMLGVSGWFSTNILGNRDGEVLDQPENFKTKEVSKLSVIDNIFEPEKFPDLYGDVYHKVRINYYPPRKDNKEAWDNIDIFGWMGYPMEIKVNFLCRDSILAAPIALDLVIFSDLALRAGMCGIQTWLSFFCKSPMHDFEHEPVHDLFQQWRMVKETLRNMVGETAPSYLD